MTRYSLHLLLAISLISATTGQPDRTLVPPIVINTWNFTRANARGWLELWAGHSSLDAVEKGCGQCQIDRCDGTVGWGGSPAENGETTLDAMIMDGETWNVGAVAGLRRIKDAIGVARLVLERTRHSLLVGDMATEFAKQFGFKEEWLGSRESVQIHKKWLSNRCQPNYWLNVHPDPTESCGPYNLTAPAADDEQVLPPRNNAITIPYYELDKESYISHDTIGMVAVDQLQRIASGTSTNGLRHKILGRVGDSPIAGAGSYADTESGAAAATGDGDVIMRHLLSYQAVENVRQGMRAQAAAEDVIKRMVARTGRPYPQVAVVVLSRDYTFGAACSGFSRFPYVVSDARKQVQTYLVECIK